MGDLGEGGGRWVGTVQGGCKGDYEALYSFNDGWVASRKKRPTPTIMLDKVVMGSDLTIMTWKQTHICT